MDIFIFLIRFKGKCKLNFKEQKWLRKRSKTFLAQRPYIYDDVEDWCWGGLETCYLLADSIVFKQ